MENKAANNQYVCVRGEEFDVRNIVNHIIDARNQREAFYVCDLNDVVERYFTWTSLMPRVKPFYAVKCNDHPIMLKTLAALGLGFDCASKEEIRTVLDLNVAPERIIYAHPVKLPSHIEYAVSKELTHTTFDCESELYKYKKLYPGAKLLIRIKCDARKANFKLGNKYGCDPTTEAPFLLRLAKFLELEVVGVCFHVGSGCKEPAAFLRAVAAARRVFDYGASLGLKFNLLDIGGGFPGIKKAIITEYAGIINLALDKCFPDLEVKVIAEPGTYFARTAFTLASNIFGIKITKAGNGKVTCDNQTKAKYVYYIDDGLYGSMHIIRYEDVTPLPLKKTSSKLSGDESQQLSAVFGPTLDPFDVIRGEVSLPKLEIGDWLMFEELGDYSLSLASRFNGFPVPKVYGVADESTWAVLKEKSPEFFGGVALNELEISPYLGGK